MDFDLVTLYDHDCFDTLLLNILLLGKTLITAQPQFVQEDGEDSIAFHIDKKKKNVISLILPYHSVVNWPSI